MEVRVARRAAAVARRPVLGPIAFASVLAIVLVALLFARDVVSGEPDPREVAVWPFHVQGDPALVYLATGVADLMAARLHDRAGLHATSPADLRRAWDRADNRPLSDTAAARMALDLGAGIVVTGEITGSRDDLLVRARLRNSTGSDPPIEREAAGALGDLPILVDRLASDLARAAAARRRTHGS